MITIAVDAMGGDFAPLFNIKGALLAAEEYDIAITLVGKKEEIEPHLDKISIETKRKINILHANSVLRRFQTNHEQVYETFYLCHQIVLL